jgi:hypothetical protein
MVQTQEKEVVIKHLEVIEIKPEQYGLLLYFLLNRKLNPKILKEIEESLLRNKVITRDVVVAWNKKNNRYVILDGQHLVHVLMKYNMSIFCKVYVCDNEAELTQLIIDMNNKGKKWKLFDYVNTWKENGLKDYSVLKNAIEIMYPYLQDTVVIQAYAQLSTREKATNMVKEGTFKIINRKKSEQYLDYIADLCSILPNTRVINQALIRLILKLGDYNHKRMIKNLKKADLTFSHTSEASVYNKLLAIYNK